MPRAKDPANKRATGPKRTPEQLLRDRAYIADLYLKRVPQYEIVNRLNTERAGQYTLTHVTITNDLEAIRKAWVQSAIVDFNEARARELAALDKLELVYWQSWERSLDDKTRTKVATRSGGPNSYDHAEEANETRDGNVAFLQGVERVIAMRIKLLGLNELEHQQAALIKAYAGFDLEQL